MRSCLLGTMRILRADEPLQLRMLPPLPIDQYFRIPWKHHERVRDLPNNVGNLLRP